MGAIALNAFVVFDLNDVAVRRCCCCEGLGCECCFCKCLFVGRRRFVCCFRRCCRSVAEQALFWAAPVPAPYTKIFHFKLSKS